ncbi:hypothetical protein AQ490_05090 [Wenjunlia vitaminophila]|uniref:HTH araC/xylS-type domain-containing protein n=1 Tax=Wenjunlia vitaminophila TaxID=76728 RepID=A0A0T6LNT1_WENVI|nr:helix-turn-helix domain-containing protein [Wenjunlia vitaminophila]KRV47754.1 hypothetical protein AQ490_05090 [Wenjunlia vitaminophila]
MHTTDPSDDDLPSRDRFAQWSELLASSIVPVRLHSDHVEDFHGTLNTRNLGSVQVFTLTYPSLRAQRTEQLIRRSDPGLCQLLVPLRGSMTLGHAGHEMTLRPRDLVIKDSSQPFFSRVPPGDGPLGHLVAQFSRSLLSFRASDVHRLTAARIRTDQGMGALLAGMLIRLGTDSQCCRPAEASRLGAVVVDLFAALLAQHLDAEAALTRDAYRRALLLRIHAFIHQHLADPELTPAVIAAAHHISLRHLHRLFHEEQTTVAAWVRQQRLEHCRQDLADPRLAARRIHTIAARWGFARAADFSRAFRSAYGVSPKDYRDIALRAAPGTHGQEKCAFC